MSNAKKAEKQVEEVIQTLMVQIDDSQLNEIIFPIIHEVNGLRRRVEALETFLAGDGK